MNPDLAYWVATVHLGISARKWTRWLKHFPNIKTLFQASYADLKAAGIAEIDIQSLQHLDWKSVEGDLTWGEKPHHHLIAFDDENYPNLLKEIANPPLVLYVKGNKTILNNKQVALVGSRHPTPLGLMNAKQFAYALAQAGLTITSGLALGIDGASHRGALAAQGATIGVAGTGLHHIYPPSHQALVEEMLNQKGAVISEFPLAMPPHPGNFPRRNRIIAALSIGTLVVEAALKSGSLITAQYALEQGREVFAIPGSIHQPLVRGCHALIRQGAKLVETVADILEELSVWHPHQASVSELVRPPIPQQAQVNDASLNTSFQNLLKHIEYEITPLDVIILRSGLTAGELSSMLLTLELNGYIKSVSGGYVRSLSS